MNYTERNREYRIKQKAKCFRTQWSLLSAKFPATANELGQRKTQLKCKENIMLTKIVKLNYNRIKTSKFELNKLNKTLTFRLTIEKQ